MSESAPLALMADIWHSRYFVVGNLAETQAEVVRIAGLLRGTESAVQAVSVCLPLALTRVYG